MWNWFHNPNPFLGSIKKWKWFYNLNSPQWGKKPSHEVQYLKIFRVLSTSCFPPITHFGKMSLNQYLQTKWTHWELCLDKKALYPQWQSLIKKNRKDWKKDELPWSERRPRWPFRAWLPCHLSPLPCCCLLSLLAAGESTRITITTAIPRISPSAHKGTAASSEKGWWQWRGGGRQQKLSGGGKARFCVRPPQFKSSVLPCGHLRYCRRCVDWIKLWSDYPKTHSGCCASNCDAWDFVLLNDSGDVIKSICAV